MTDLVQLVTSLDTYAGPARDVVELRLRYRDIERPRTNSQTVRFSYPTEDSHRLTLAWERGRTGAFSKVGVSGFLGKYALVTDQDRAATSTAPRSVERASVSAGDFHLRGFAQRPVGRARLEAGVDLNGRSDLEALEIRERYDDEGALASREQIVAIESARRVDTGVYASVDSPVGRALAVAGGLRGDVVQNRNRGGWFGDLERSSGAVSGFAALTAGPLAGFSATAQAARGFRDPTLSDRYFRGVSGRGFVVGNPDLVAETSSQWDLALRGRAGLVNLGLSGYVYRIEDLIERYRDGNDYRFRNRGEAEIAGVELEADVRVAPRLVVRLLGSLSQGRILDDGTWAPDILPPTAQLVVDHEPVAGLFWRAHFVAMGRDERPGSGEVVVAGYSRLDLSAGYRVSDRLTVTVSARNVFDKAYADSADELSVVAPGRGAILTLSGAF